MNTNKITGLFVGKPKIFPPIIDNPRWLVPMVSSIMRSPVEGPVKMGRLGLIGDKVGNPLVHGGPEKAVLIYAAAHYPRWETEYHWEGMGPGGFGENLLVEGFEEATVCIGDLFQAGEAVVEVTQPRQPCSKLARRWKNPELPAIVNGNFRTGWYIRVLQEGRVKAGDEYVLLERKHPEWTIVRALQAMLAKKQDPGPGRELAQLPELSEDWRKALV